MGVPIEANMSQLLDVPNSLGTLGLYPKVYFVFIFFKASFRIFRGNKKHEKNIFSKYRHVGTLNLYLEIPDSMEKELI